MSAFEVFILVFAGTIVGHAIVDMAKWLLGGDGDEKRRSL